jgi:hypothetical protein
MLARQPGARPPCGGWIESTSRPLRVISQEMMEFEFHISPVRSSSRPQTGVGTCGTSRSSRRARSASSLGRCGLSTASRTSGDDAVAPAPDLVAEEPKAAGRTCADYALGTTPCSLSALHAGTCSITNRPSRTRTSSAEWSRSRRSRCSSRASDSLEDACIQAHRVSTGAQREPVEIDAAVRGRSHWSLLPDVASRVCATHEGTRSKQRR